LDIKKELLKEHSKAQAVKISNYIGDDPEKFNQLITLFLADEYRVTQRAAWVVSHCADQYPKLIEPHLEQLILNLKNQVHVAVKRNTVRVLQDVEIPEELLGETADICFNLMQSGEETIAVKVFAMTVLGNICVKFPELKNELIPLIEDQMPYGSAGFKSRGKKILKNLTKL
jgi:hypothetical protein